MKQHNFFALSLASMLILIGAGCQSSATVDTSSSTQTPPSVAEEGQLDIQAEGEPTIDMRDDIKEGTDVKVNADTDIQVKLDTKPKAEVKNDTTAKVETTPEVPPVTPPKVEVKEEVKVTVKDFTITASNFKFAPASLTVKKGDKVRITFKNSGGFHDFVIDEFLVATKQIGDGAQDVVEFTADKVGTFEYYCSVGSHRAMGMKGTLTVTQ